MSCVAPTFKEEKHLKLIFLKFLFLNVLKLLFIFICHITRKRGIPYRGSSSSGKKKIKAQTKVLNILHHLSLLMAVYSFILETHRYHFIETDTDIFTE